MNINKINQRWPISCKDSLAAIDRMSASEALDLGLITTEECNAITEEFVMHLTFYMETKGYIQNWLQVLKDDKRFIVSAAGKAEKAVNLILG